MLGLFRICGIIFESVTNGSQLEIGIPKVCNFLRNGGRLEHNYSLAGNELNLSTEDRSSYLFPTSTAMLGNWMQLRSYFARWLMSLYIVQD